MKVVLDANVLIAAVAGRGLCESVMELCLEDHDLAVSAELLAEVRRSLLEKIHVPEAIADEFSRFLRSSGLIVKPSPVPPDACRDPNDLHVLGLAQASEAIFLVTGDKDLLALGRFGATRILTPRQFWDQMAGR